MRHSDYSFDRYTLKIWRKALHVSSSWIGLVYIYAGIPHTVFLSLLGLSVALFFLFDLFRYLFPRFNASVRSFFSGFFIERDDGRLNSATWYVLSIFLVVLLFGGESHLQRLRAGIPVLLLAWGDTAASVVGKLYGRRRMWWLCGTVVGFFACVVVSALVCLAFQLFDGSMPGWFWLPPLIGLVTAVAEGLPVPLDDNLTIVVLTGAFFFLLF